MTNLDCYNYYQATSRHKLESCPYCVCYVMTDAYKMHRRSVHHRWPGTAFSASQMARNINT